jgi:hypothetical protein
MRFAVDLDDEHTGRTTSDIGDEGAGHLLTAELGSIQPFGTQPLP